MTVCNCMKCNPFDRGVIFTRVCQNCWKEEFEHFYVGPPDDHIYLCQDGSGCVAEFEDRVVQTG